MKEKLKSPQEIWPLKVQRKDRQISQKETRQLELDGGWSWIWWCLAAATKKSHGEKMEGVLIPDVCTFFQGQLFHMYILTFSANCSSYFFLKKKGGRLAQKEF